MDSEMEQFCSDLLQSVQEMNAGKMARKTEFIPQNNGTVKRLITLADGTVEREDILSDIVYTRIKPSYHNRSLLNCWACRCGLCRNGNKAENNRQARRKRC